MNSSLTPQKARILLIVGLVLSLVAIVGLILIRWYAGLILMVPLAIFYIWQVWQLLRNREK